uniref:Uncharacterized protein n=1 Tax=Ceratitis capitata TaxID=7213 RepID=W8B9L7_CERCA
MPTLAAKNSQANTAIPAYPTITTTAGATAVAAATMNSVGSDGIDVGSGATIATTIDTTNTSGGTLNHHYHHPPAPHTAGANALGHNSVLATPATTGSSSAVTSATGTVAASLATFNGNSNLNVANGNIGGSGNHSSSSSRKCTSSSNSLLG